MPSQDATMQGYVPPGNTQFSVFLDNRCGKLLELLGVFDDRQLGLAALNVVESADCAIARLLTTDSDLARQTLRDNAMSFSESSVLVVELSGQATLQRLCRSLLGAELNIHAAYPLLVCQRATPTIVLHCDDMYLAGQILCGKGFDLLGEGDLAMGDRDEGSFDTQL